MANAKIIEQKAGVVSEIKEKFENAKSVVAFDYRGLSVAEVTELRRKLREAGADYKVYKNTLMARAFNDLGIDFPIVEGVDLHSTLSMPSGHTSAVFAFCFSLALFCPKWWQKMLCLLIAILVGYSRIYLSQHFLADVLAGSIVGIVAVLILIPLIKKLRKTE